MFFTLWRFRKFYLETVKSYGIVETFLYQLICLRIFTGYMYIYISFTEFGVRV